MSHAEDFFGDWELDEDDQRRYDKDSFDMLVSINRRIVNECSTDKLVNKVLHCNKVLLKQVAKFPAYELAERYKYQRGSLSDKQRTAMVNILAFYITKYN